MLNWYVVHVRSKHEFVTGNELTRKGIEMYLPAVTMVRQWKDRKKAVQFPLFPGYLFVYIKDDPEQYLTILKTRGAVNFICLIPGEPTPVASGEIDSLKVLMESGRDVNIFPQLREGTKVRVTKGPLVGAEGLLAAREGSYLFIVNINLLGRSVGVKVTADGLEVV